MELHVLQAEVGRLLGLYSAEVKAASALSHTDINTASDAFLVELLGETFGLIHLRNLNEERENFPGLDLADDPAGVAFQVTAERDLRKILNTLRTSIAHDLHKRYPRIRVFVTSERQNRYTQSSIDAVTRGELAFDAKADILDYRDLLKLYKFYDLERLQRIATILRRHLSPAEEGAFTPRLAEALERDVAARFQEAIDQGPFPEVNERNLFAPLAQQVLEEYRGKLSPELSRAILIRAARRAAILKHVDDADRFLAAAGAIRAGESTLVAEALVAEARGSIDTALRMLRDQHDPLSIATTLGILLRQKGGDAALEWMSSSSIREDTLNAIGVITLSILYVPSNRIEEFVALLETLPTALFDECPYLIFLRGILRLVSVFPKPDQLTSLGGIPLVVEGTQPILDEAPLARRLDASAEDLQRFMPLAHRLKLPLALATAEWFLLWAALLHPHRRVAAAAQLERDMEDPVKAIRRVQLAFRYLPDFDAGSLAQYLARRERFGGWGEEELFAALQIRVHRGEHGAVAALIAKYRSRLEARLTAPMTLLLEVQALALSNEASSARALLDKYRGHTDPALVSRLEAEIAKTEGADPVAQDLRLYEEQKTLSTLRVLVESLKRHKAYRLLGPYAEKLYAETADPEDLVVAAKAYDAVDERESFFRIVESSPMVLTRSADVKRRYAWHLFLSGRLVEATRAAQKLRQTPAQRDIALEISLAIETGQWEQLASLLGHYLENADQFDARTLIQAAQLAHASGYGPFRELMLVAVTKPEPTAEVLLGAYTIAVDGGLEEGDRAPHEWFNRSLELSGPQGPVQRIEIKELLDRQLEWNRHTRSINDAITHGEVPLVAAAPSLRTTLVDIFLGNFLRNTEQRDARKRVLIPAFSGRRLPEPLGPVSRVAFDTTAVLMLGALGLLPKALSSFTTVVVPAGLMHELLQGQRKLRQYQKSRVVRAAQLQALVRGRLRVLRSIELSPGDPVAAEVGLELAALLHEAQSRSGVVVRPAPVHQLGSGAHQTADLSSYAAQLTDLHALLDVLKTHGLVDRSAEEFAARYFKLQDVGWSVSVRPERRTPLYLDDVAISFLQTTQLLGVVVEFFDEVYILASSEEQAAAMVEMERQSLDIEKVLGVLRESLSSAYQAGRVIFAPQRANATPDERDAPATLNLLSNMMAAEVVVIDDRALNKEPFATDNQGHRARVATTLDVIEDLAARGVLSTLERFDARHRLRVAGAALVPVDSEEVRQAAQRSQAVESVEFRAVSESIALAQMRNMPRFPAEIPWFVSIVSGLREAIKAAWQDTADRERARALADLIFAELPSPPDWVGCWDGAAPLGWSEAMTRILDGGLALPTIFGERESRQAYWTWLDERVLNRIRRLDPSRYEAIVEHVKLFILKLSAAGDDDTPPEKATAARLSALLALDRLPPDLLSAVVADGAIAQKLGIGLTSRPLEFGQAYTVGRDELFAAFAEAADGRVATVSISMGGSPAEAAVSIGADGAALVETPTAKVQFAHAALWTPDAERRRHVLAQALQTNSLTQTAITQLHSLLLTGVPNFENFRQATDLLNASPEMFAASLESKLVTGKLQEKDLVPDDPRYWDNLTAEWKDSPTLANFIQGELRLEREARHARTPTLAKVALGLQFTGQELVPHEWLAQWSSDEVVDFVELLSGCEDHVSLAAGFEICARQLTRDLRLVTLGEQLLDRLFGDPERLLNRCQRFAAGFVLATARLARQESTRARPVFWRRSAAAAHAALVARSLGHEHFGGEELFDWAMQVRGEYFILSVYLEMGNSPRWQPEWIEPDSLVADAFGRIQQAANALGPESVPAAWLDKIARAEQWMGDRELISRSWLASPTQGERPAIAHQAPEPLKLRADELYRELCAHPTARNLIGLANITELTGVPADYADAIRQALGYMFADNALEKEWVQPTLAVSARMAVMSRNGALAELVSELGLKAAARDIDTLGVFETVLRLLECVAADADTGLALSKMARWLESLALTLAPGAAHDRLFATLRKLQRLDDDQAPLWARATNIAKLGISPRTILP